MEVCQMSDLEGWSRRIDEDDQDKEDEPERLTGLQAGPFHRGKEKGDILNDSGEVHVL